MVPFIELRARRVFAVTLGVGLIAIARAQGTVPQWRITQEFKLDGVSDHVRITDRSEFRVESFTLAAWVRTVNTPLNQPVISKALAKGNWTSYMLRLQANGRISLVVENDKDNASAHWLSRKAIAGKQCHHVAATWRNSKGDASDATIYLDGEPLKLDMIRNVGYGPAFRIGYSAEPLFIGRDEYPSGHFKGSIKGVTIIGRIREPREIEKLAAHREPKGEGSE